MEDDLLQEHFWTGTMVLKMRPTKRSTSPRSCYHGFTHDNHPPDNDTTNESPNPPIRVHANFTPSKSCFFSSFPFSFSTGTRHSQRDMPPTRWHDDNKSNRQQLVLNRAHPPWTAAGKVDRVGQLRIMLESEDNTGRSKLLHALLDMDVVANLSFFISL